MNVSIDSINLEKDFESLDTTQIVQDAINQAFGNDDSENVGSIENHCDKQTKEYYLKLADKNQEALKRQEEMLKKFLRDERY